MRKSILVFSGFNQRAVIAFLRTVKHYSLDFDIIALPSEDSIFYSEYKEKIFCNREKKTLDFDDIYSCVLRLKKEKKIDSIFIAPTSEALNRFLLDYRLDFEKLGCIIPLVDKKLYEEISDKEKFCNLCKNYGISIPDVVKFKKENIPFVVKPKVYNIQGKTPSPILVLDKSDFDKICYIDEDYYCQEYVTGKSYYILFYFSNNGSVRKLYQENLLQQEQGKSIIAAKVINSLPNCDSELFETLFLSINFLGLVMVELRIKNQKCIMIEANPRFWGPSQLFVDYGCNFFVDLLNDYGFKIIPDDKKKSDLYFWSGGLGENMLNHGFKINEKNIFIKNDIYKRSDTMQIYERELVAKLEKKYKDISKHSQYQILPERLNAFLNSNLLNINSRAEKERFTFISTNVNIEGATILDIGANTGYFSFECLEKNAKKVTCYEGNKVHAQFIQMSAELLKESDKVSVFPEYYLFEDTEKYNIGFLLNVLHHIGDDYGDSSLNIENAKKMIIQQLNSMSKNCNILIFQLGFNWKGNKNCCLFENGTKKELIDFVSNGIKEFWSIKKIGIAEKTNSEIKYCELNEKNIQRKDELGEFLNRPLFILQSKTYNKIL